MKVLLVGSLSGWMGLHISHIGKGFASKGHEVYFHDYHLPMEQLFGKIAPEYTEELRHRLLEKKLRHLKPDLLFFVASWKYDLARIKSAFSGICAIHDLDGPRRLPADFAEPFRQADLPLTASRYMVRKLAEYGISAIYLPSAVDTEYYSPGNITPADKQLYSAPVSYIGRATGRRVEMLAQLKDSGLALYGDRWHKRKDVLQAGLLSAIRTKRLVRDREVVAIYQSSDLVLNILQEPLDEFKTILSLQCFAIPATGACLLAEFVEEADEAFENGKEILIFHDKDELAALTEKYCRDRKSAAAIAAAGRARCLQCHTHAHRAAELERILN